MVDNKEEIRKNENSGFPFDPGFVVHLSAFVPNIESVYELLNSYRNFNQKKLQFRMYYPKIQSLLKNYVSFYLGCILWAVYLKQFKNSDILNNLCFGGEYSDDETLQEVDFVKNYIEQLKKDAKYYVGQNFIPDERYSRIIDTYREFLKLNEGFVKLQKTDDIKLPENIKPIENLEFVREKIDSVVSSGNLYELLELTDKVL